jgi:hypothetical protein
LAGIGALCAHNPANTNLDWATIAHCPSRRFTSFGTYSIDQYFVKATADASDGAVTNLLSIGVAFDRVA